VVAPGQIVAVTVTTTGTYQVVFMSGQNPLPPWFDSVSATSPYHFQVSIPNTIAPGNYRFLATGGIAPGQVVDSVPVILDVEYPNSATGLRSDPTTVFFQFVGDQTPIGLYATFGTATPITVNGSSKITYVSSDKTIVTVNNAGIATATGSGKANVLVTYAGQSISVPVVVPQAKPGDLNADGKVDTDDLNILDSALNTPANGPNDARDLNHDGVINALDARILTTLCTYPRCATHQ